MTDDDIRQSFRIMSPEWAASLLRLLAENSKDLQPCWNNFEILAEAIVQAAVDAAVAKSKGA